MADADPDTPPARRAVAVGGLAALAALAVGLIVDGGLSASRWIFALLLGVSVGLAYMALRSTR